MSAQINLSIVIPSLNGEKHFKDFLVRNLETIKNVLESTTEYNLIEMIVVDDNSTDGSLSYLYDCQKKYSFLKVERNPKRGICSARNHGISRSKTMHLKNAFNYILNFDNDVLLHNDFLINAVKYLKQNKFCITCHGVSYFTNKQVDGVKLLSFKRGYFRFTKNVFNEQLNKLSGADLLPSYGAQGAYFFININDFVELKGFDETLDPYMYDDSDIVYRGLKRGKECIYAPDVIGYHKIGGTIASKTSKRTLYLSKRNRNYFVWKNLHDRKLLLSHVFYLIISVFTPMGFKSFFGSFGMLKKAIKFNLTERKYIKVSDSELLSQSSKIESRYK